MEKSEKDKEEEEVGRRTTGGQPVSIKGGESMLGLIDGTEPPLAPDQPPRAVGDNLKLNLRGSGGALISINK